MVVTGLLIAAFVLLWAGVTLLIDAWQRRPRRPTLAERLQDFAERSLTWEAQDWLHAQSED